MTHDTMVPPSSTTSLNVESMDLPELAPGHTVKFQGLQGVAHLNGTKGTIVRFDAAQQ